LRVAYETAFLEGEVKGKNQEGEVWTQLRCKAEEDKGRDTFICEIPATE
jgi:hypothetical protein